MPITPIVGSSANLVSRGVVLSANRIHCKRSATDYKKIQATNLTIQLSDKLGRFLEEHADTTESFGFIEYVAEQEKDLGDSDVDDGLSEATLHT